MDPSGLAALHDRIAVEEVLVACAHTQDRRDWVAYAACFEPDAAYVHPKGRIDGIEEIVARSRGALDALDACQHLVGSIAIEVDGDTAHATSYFHAQHVRAAAEGGELFVISGTYADVLGRRDGRWRIVERTQSYVARWGNPAVIVR